MKKRLILAGAIVAAALVATFSFSEAEAKAGETKAPGLLPKQDQRGSDFVVYYTANGDNRNLLIQPDSTTPIYVHQNGEEIYAHGMRVTGVSNSNVVQVLLFNSNSDLVTFATAGPVTNEIRFDPPLYIRSGWRTGFSPSESGIGSVEYFGTAAPPSTPSIGGETFVVE